MICLPCRDAGKALLSNPVLAARDHALCQKVQETAGKTWCDCKHQLESALNMSLIKPKGPDSE